MNKKHISILGSTGSIGTQAVEVIANNPDLFVAEALVANNNADLLIKQARLLEPNMVVIANEEKYQYVKESLSDLPIKVFTGYNSVLYAAEFGPTNLVITAMVGFAGLKPTIKAIEAGKVIALANKETLVVAGELITRLARAYKAPIIPVDSEHSAIFQCLLGENMDSIEKLILTASGGPFRGMKYEELKNVSVKQALNHPNWAMGNKVTIDSASMMNKGLEVIEAHWLFGISLNKIDVVVHPQSIIHSMVQFTDGSVKAQLSPPDMRLPIQYAMSFPNRTKSDFPRFLFDGKTNLSFELPDRKVFRNLDLAYIALEKGGNMPCILNAANEVAVELFLKGNISFVQMSELIQVCMERVEFIANPEINDYEETNTITRKFAFEIHKNLK
jgi:1-deoxy-D-xylulose-5-phosphate reductoisomerase